MNRYLIFILLSLLVSSCAEHGVKVLEKGSKDQFEVYELFEVNNCKIYRFYDAMRLHYFTNCVTTMIK